jgi:hypothetical protein
MSHNSVSYISGMSDMQNDDMHWPSRSVRNPFRDLRRWGVRYATYLSHLPVDIRHI